MPKSIRSKILLLTFLTLVPAITLIISLNFTQRQRAIKVKTEQLQQLASQVAAENEQIFEGARQLLITLSVAPEIRQPACGRYLARLLNQYQRYGNFGVANTQGNVICSARPLTGSVNLADRYFFQQTKTSGNFTIGRCTAPRGR